MARKDVHVARPAQAYDAIVVGSGIAGGWAAKELCEHGLRTLVLERGRPVAHGADYVTEHAPPWSLAHRGRLDPRLLDEHYFIQRRTGFLDETTLHFFFRDSESPYVEEQPFTWVRGHQVGGKSLMWGRYTFRISDLDFEANAREGIGVDWPIRYGDIEPWYAYVERFAGISGEKLGLPHLPDGVFQQPIPLNVVELDLRRRIEAAYPERRLTIARAAVLTEPLPGRQPCHYCGPCWRGCSTGSYFSSQSSTLPAAVATGNLTLRPHSVVHSIVYDERRDRATGVRVVDAETKEMREYTARVIFLCASTLGSTQVLLNSRSPRFPEGLGGSSDALGRNLMDHHFYVGAEGEVEGFRDRYTYGNRPVGFYIPRYRNISAETRMETFRRGYGIEGEAGRPSWGRGTELPGFGADFKAQLRDPGPWHVWMTAFGETLPRPENRVRLDADLVDAFGIPQLRIHCTWGPNELAMRADMAASSAEMLERCGLRNVQPYDQYQPGQLGAEPGLGIHEMGTARMGRDPRTSVLNAHNQVWDAPNVFVTDGACMVSSPCQNPSITYMALTARAVDHAVAEMNRGNSVNRRDAVQRIGLLLGTAVTPRLARAVEAGFAAPPAGQALRALTPAQGELVVTLAELIIPTTDTPGARAARVHAFIDGLLADIFPADERDRFVTALADVDARARAAAGAAFVDCTAAQQVAVLAALERDASAGGDGRPFFSWLKELTLVGYYTSEIGATQELRYVHAAGRYDGDVPYDEVGRAYS